MQAGFAYCQARIQARFAALAGPDVWQHMDATHSQSGYLEEARQTPLAHWVSGLSRVSDIHHIEQGLRQRLLQIIRETRGWAPARWQAAIAWTEWLLELPLLRHILIAGERPEWITEDSALFPLLVERETDLVTSLSTSPAVSILQPEEPDELPGHWLARWREIWPRCSRQEVRQLEILIDLIGDQAGELSAPRQAGNATLNLGLRRLFRRHALRPVALFAWLGMATLEMERLRGALIVRSAFPPSGGE